MEITEKITICLNMIVKNESKIITRLFDSLHSIIDCYCICDTGSTDNTKETITNYFNEKNIPGKIFDTPFKNFGYNRTKALQEARNMATYILLLDADMTLTINSDFNKSSLQKDVYSIQQGNSTFKYFNTRLVLGSLDVKCVGPTHEYYDLPKGTSTDQLNSIFINDIGDGGCKDNKFSRDIRLLKEGLIKEPKNGRYYFYLANSYYNSNFIDEAIEMYKKRIELGGWIEEVWYSYYRLGACYQKKGENEKAIFTWLDGYDYFPKRVENIYEIVKYYRIQSKHRLADYFYKLGKNIPLPKDNVLFLHHDVYDFLFDYEFTIFGYYLSPRPNILPHFMKLFNTNHNLDTNHLLSNFVFYCKPIVHTISHNLNDTFENYKSSSPSIIPYKKGYLLNIRYVDYRLNKNGDYTYHDGYHVQTRNRAILMDDHFNITKSTHWNPAFDDECRIRGIEDVKIIECGEKIYFMGTKQIPQGMKLCMCWGEYDLSDNKLNVKCFESPKKHDCEKNWALFSHNNELHFVYEWSPLTIGKITDKSVDIIAKKEMPPIFKLFRGSSNGFLYNHEYWFVCHIVHHSKPRHYYHCIVVLDAETLTYKRHSRFFTFSGEKIEFCLGIIVREKTILMSHSCWDSTSELKIYDKNELLKDIFEY